MSDGSSVRDFGSAGAESADNGNKRPVLKRRTYVAMRLAEMVEEIKRLADERVELSKRIDGHGVAKSDEVRHLRHRRMYIAARLEMLRAEQQDLHHERKQSQAADVSPKPKTAKTQEEKARAP